jgi:hypothetical protein
MKVAIYNLLFICLLTQQIFGQDSFAFNENNLLGKLKIDNVSIIITDFAEVKEAADNWKAVFIRSDNLEKFNGVIVTVEMEINNPLFRVYKKPNLFPPVTMKRYSDNKWFFYGDSGSYIIEYLDTVNGSWVSEFVEVEIAGTVIPVRPIVPEPTKPPVDNESFAKIRSETTRIIKGLNDPTTTGALYRESLKASQSLAGSVKDMQTMMRNARMAAFQSVPSRIVNWNDALLTIDQVISDSDVSTPERYKAAIEAYVNGLKDAL